MEKPNSWKAQLLSRVELFFEKHEDWHALQDLPMITRRGLIKDMRKPENYQLVQSDLELLNLYALLLKDNGELDEAVELSRMVYHTKPTEGHLYNYLDVLTRNQVEEFWKVVDQTPGIATVLPPWLELLGPVYLGANAEEQFCLLELFDKHALQNSTAIHLFSKSIEDRISASNLHPEFRDFFLETIPHLQHLDFSEFPSDLVAMVLLTLTGLTTIVSEHNEAKAIQLLLKMRNTHSQFFQKINQ